MAMRGIPAAGSSTLRFGSRLTMPSTCQGLLVAAIMALLCTGSARHASAHASLIESDPADGATLQEAPEAIHLRLSERASQQFSSAQLLDTNGRVIAGSEIRITRPGPTSLVLHLPSLATGSYTLFWKVFSEDDGHFSKGLLAFGVGVEASLAPAAAPRLASRPDTLEVGLRWAGFSLLAMLVGAVGVVRFVLNDRAPDDLHLREHLREARCRVLAWSAGCSCLALLAGVGLLGVQAASLQETPLGRVSSWELLLQMIGQTRWGAIWLLREVLLFVMTGVLFLMYRAEHRRSRCQLRADDTARDGWWRSLWSAAAACALLLVTAQALLGHAVGVGEQVWLAVPADALHVAAAGLWVGGLAVLAYGLLPLMRTDRVELAAIARIGWRRFSRLAAIAVCLLFLTGFYALGRQVASLDALITTVYGLSLLAKIGLVMAMGMIGLLNAAILHPGFAAALSARILGHVRGWQLPSLPWLPNLIRLDIGLAVLVLLLTGLITSSPAPRDAAFNVAPEDVRDQQTRLVDDLMITLSIKPGRPGRNLLTAFVASTRRPPLAEIARVVARFTFQGRDLGRVSAVGEAIEPGRYAIGGRQLSMAGPWRIDVVVRRLGISDSVARFDWVVPPAGIVEPTFLSKRPIRPVTDVIAGIASLALVWALASIFGRTLGRSAIERLRHRAPVAGAVPNDPRAIAATRTAE